MSEPPPDCLGDTAQHSTGQAALGSYATVHRLSFLIAIALVATACGGSGATRTSVSGAGAGSAGGQVDRAILGAPNTPRWLRIRIWRAAQGLSDPHPARIVVTLRLHERGRLVDRVWMRGNFICNACTYPYGAKAPRGHLADFTVIDSTRRSLSFSLSPG